MSGYTLLCGRSGQTTVEAAYLIPVIFLLMLVLCQPMILFYNHMVMSNAAAEGCRLLATRTSAGAYSAEKYEGYIQRRLASIPSINIFHVRSGAETWDIDLEGDENSQIVTVRITNHVQPLPLLDWTAELAGMCNEEGYIEQVVEVTTATQPDWAWNSGSGPSEWTNQWD